MVFEKKESADRKRLRMSSDEVPSEIADSEMLANMEMLESMGNTVNTEKMGDMIWSFLRENNDELVAKIVQSASWNQYASNRDVTISELEQENKQLQSRLAVAEGAVTRCEHRIKLLEEKVTDLTSRSMRDNILIKNMPEEEHEDDDKLELKVRQIFDKDLRIPTAEMMKINIDRIHRVGKQGTDRRRSRNIVAKLDSKGKAMVMRHLKNLDKNSHIKITEQFPHEVHANRDKLWPTFIDAKKKGKRARWNVDQLLIDGRTVHPPNDKCRDINLDVTGKALELDVKHTEVITRNSNHFQGHSVAINSTDDVVPALKALCKESSIAGASHVMYAYRVGDNSRSIHNWEDDGEWGGGKKIMEAIQGKNVYNQLVCVTRWSSSVQHLGPARFDIIKEVSNSALQNLSAF